MKESLKESADVTATGSTHPPCVAWTKGSVKDNTAILWPTTGTAKAMCSNSIVNLLSALNAQSEPVVLYSDLKKCQSTIPYNYFLKMSMYTISYAWAGNSVGEPHLM